MSDLIDRQAAIATAISGRVRTLPTTEDGEDWIRVNEVRDSLLTLPSAQPTQTNKSNALKSLDCISRQAALDVLKRLARGQFNLSDEYIHYLAGLLDAEIEIKKLPYCPNCGAYMKEDSDEAD